MRKNIFKLTGAAITAMLMLTCRQVYEPKAVQGVHDYLVVDGTLVSGDSTIINLSRARSLGDSNDVANPELNAQLMVIGEASEIFPLQELGSGKYATSQLIMNNTEKYQLKIITSNGKEYLSDAITAKQTPPIDSVSWKTDTGGVRIYVTTHDPLNNTRYYRWNFTETWEYHTNTETGFDVMNGQFVARNPLIYNCWTSNNSTAINIGTSIKLSSDVIFEYPIQYIPFGSEKISHEYSILVRQYGISVNTYNYWLNLQKNSEGLGTLFDPQPSQLPGNIHCTSVPDEPVLGYLDASTLQEQRIFINDGSVIGLHYVPYYSDKGCLIRSFTDVDSLSIYFPDSGTRQWVFIGSTPQGAYLYTSSFCGDCRVHGGTNIKPDFWP